MTVITFLSLYGFLVFLKLLIAWFSIVPFAIHILKTLLQFFLISKAFLESLFSRFFISKALCCLLSNQLLLRAKAQLSPWNSLSPFKVGFVFSWIPWLYLLSFFFSLVLLQQTFPKKEHAVEVHFMSLCMYGNLSSLTSHLTDSLFGYRTLSWK